MKTDALFIVVLMAIAAIVIYMWPETESVAAVSDDPNARDTVGASSVPAVNGDPVGPAYLTYNMPWKMDASVARFLAMPVASNRLQ